MTLSLAGCRIGITSSRKVEELSTLLERRGAAVEHAPALTYRRLEEDPALRAATEACISQPPDILVATTGVGIRAWMSVAESWGLADALTAALAGTEVIARGPKSVGAVRALGLREHWAPESECFEDQVAYLLARDLTGRRVVLQEHGTPLEGAAEKLRLQGADVLRLSLYRSAAGDGDAMERLVRLVADRKLDAVTFTSGPAVEVLRDVAASADLTREVQDAFRRDVLAVCVGPVTAAPFRAWGVPAVQPERARLAAMVKALEQALMARGERRTLVAGGHAIVLHGERVLVDGTPVRLSPAPFALLRVLASRPGVVMSRQQLMEHLPSASSEHAVEVAVARLRAAIGADVVRTVVKRGYRLDVEEVA